MLGLELLGALLLFGGVVYMAWGAIHRGKLSDPARNPNDAGKRTLEPRHRGFGFLGSKGSLPGLAVAALGALLLLSALL